MIKFLLILFMVFSQLVANDSLSAYKSLKSLESTLESQIGNELKLYTTSPSNVSVKVFTDQIQTTKVSGEKHSLPGIYEPSLAEYSKKDLSLKTELNHIEVTITLDAGVDPSIVSLARKIAYEKANLSDMRGDKVIVTKKALQIKKNNPEVSEAILDKIKTLDNQVSKVGSSVDKKISSISTDVNKKIANLDTKNQDRLRNSEERLQNKINSTKDETSLAMKKNSDAIGLLKENGLYLLLLMLVAFIIFSYLVFIYFSNLSKKNNEHVRVLETKLQQDIDGVKTHLDKAIQDIDTNEKSEIDQQLINDLSTLVIARKSAVKVYIKEALRTPNGEEKIALLAHVLGTKAISALLFKDSNILNEVLTVANKYQFKSEEIESLSNDLYKELLEKTKNQDSQDLDEFAFVKNMDIDQLLLLLEGEDIGIQAFILTQVEKVTSAKVLSRLDENLRVQLLVELSNIRPMDAQTYSALSNKLSLKIAKSPKVNHFVLNGESEMATQILYLQPKEQTTMLNKILTQDATLYNRIKEKYLFAEDIDKLDNSLIKTLLLSMNDLDVSLSLYQLNTQLQQKILSELSERKMVMIDENIKHFEEVNPTSEKMSLALYNFLSEANKLRKKSL